MRRVLLASIIAVTLCACAPCDERLEQALFDFVWATKSQLDERRSTLKSIVDSCPVPDSGVSNRFDGNTHPAQIFFIVGEYRKAADVLESEHVELTEMQQFDLVSFAAYHQDPEVLDLVLASGVDPTISEPSTGATTIMHASQSSFSPVERMTLLRSLGVNPLAVSDAGFSALDYAIADGEEAAVQLVLKWIDASLPDSKRLVLSSIEVAAKTGDDSRAQQLQTWLTERTPVDAM